LGKPDMKGTLTIDGNKSNINPPIASIVGSLFFISDEATLIMNNGVTMKDNFARSSDGGWGGGVDIERGTFIMNGGTITGNKADYGGGVIVGANSTFTMNNGTITGNEADQGGGVFVDYYGTFTMNNGTISGNSAPTGESVFIDEFGNFYPIGGLINPPAYRDQ